MTTIVFSRYDLDKLFGDFFRFYDFPLATSESSAVALLRFEILEHLGILWKSMKYI